jgi:hypothetical protein
VEWMAQPVSTADPSRIDIAAQTAPVTLGQDIRGDIIRVNANL